MLRTFGVGKRTNQVTAVDVQSLRQATAAQQRQLQQQQKLLEELRADLRDQTIQEVHLPAEQAQSSADRCAGKSTVRDRNQEKLTVSQLQSDVATALISMASTQTTKQE